MSDAWREVDAVHADSYTDCMEARLYFRIESELHDECRERLIEALPARTTPIRVPPVAGGNLSSVIVQGPPDADVYKAVTEAIHTLPWDLWSPVCSLTMDDEASERAGRMANAA
jgi:hypothetical protein